MQLTKLLSRSGPSGFDIYAIVTNDVCIVWEYISTLVEEDKKKILLLLNSISSNGIPHSEYKFKFLGDDIFELKTSGGTRILCFFGGSSLPRSLILTHGFNKPKRKILQREKEKALEWRKEYFEITDINEKIIIMEGTS